LQKLEDFRVKAPKGEVVVFYFEPLATQNLKPSGFPEGETTWKIDTILLIHQWRYPEKSAISIITTHYLSFAMLFMQLWGIFDTPHPDAYGFC